MPDAEVIAMKSLDWAMWIGIMLIVMAIAGRILMAYEDVKRMPKPDVGKSEPPDMLQQAIINVAIHDMERKLRELLVYGEQNEISSVLREYLRLKDESEKKAKNDQPKSKTSRTRRRAVQVP